MNRIVGNYERLSFDSNGDLEVTFKVSRNNFQARGIIESLDKEIKYSLKIEKYKERRTDRQNRYMWELCGELANKINGDNKADEIYKDAIIRFSQKFTFMVTLHDALPILEKNFRAVKYIRDQEINGKSFGVYQCFEGSSKFNKEEMALVIDGLLLMASECGLDLNYWREVFK